MIFGELMNYLEDIAKKNSIKVIFENRLSPYTPSGSNVVTRRIVVNTNWHVPREISFQLAHEIGHILCDHKESSILYFTPSKIGMELEANIKAIDLLIPLYTYEKEREQINLTDFMSFFGVPSRLYDTVKQQFNIFIQENM